MRARDARMIPRGSLHASLAAALASVLLLASCSSGCAAASGAAALPWPLANGTWRDHAVWRDGLAEKATYEATRSIYGLERRYVAIAYTDQERVDPRTTCKALDPGASGTFEAFKHHWSERVPTENYDYDFSTSLYLGADDLAPYKLSVGTQEDCGASFKQCVSASDGFLWWESVYFPGAGTREGRITAVGTRLEDELPLLLRDFPFEHAPNDVQGKLAPTFGVRLLPSQKDTRSVPWEPLDCLLIRGPRTLLELPIGQVDAWEVDLVVAADLESARGGSELPVRARYWLAADGAPPWLHVLVQYQGPLGVTYRLQALERSAYWRR